MSEKIAERGTQKKRRRANIVAADVSSAVEGGILPHEVEGEEVFADYFLCLGEGVRDLSAGRDATALRQARCLPLPAIVVADVSSAVEGGILPHEVEGEEMFADCFLFWAKV